MKKTLFIAFAVVGFSQFSFAQEAGMKPAPTQAEANRETQAKAASKQEVAAKSTKADPAAVAEYKKIGLNDNQIAAVNKTNNYYDAKKTEITNNTKLTTEEKKNQLAALEAERNTVLRKRMGDDSYKKYNEVNSGPAKAAPAKKEVKPASKPAN